LSSCALSQDNVFVRGIRKMKHAMFSESEEGETLSLIKKLDPAWDLHEMLVMLEEKVLQKWVESFLRGDEEGIEFISHWCTDRALQVRPRHAALRNATSYPLSECCSLALHLSDRTVCRRGALLRCASCTSRSGSGSHRAREWTTACCSSRR
jgi:hypothetical protein